MHRTSKSPRLGHRNRQVPEKPARAVVVPAILAAATLVSAGIITAPASGSVTSAENGTAPAAVVGAAAPAAAPAAPLSDAAYRDPELPTEDRVADLLARMTLAEKAGQMTQGERGSLVGNPQDIAELGLGSVLSGGGSAPADNTPDGWADMVDAFQEQALTTRLGIPILYGVDAVHGHGNLDGATIFPHNIGLGATRDPELVREAARVTAVETRASGVPWTFSPCVCVVRDDRWGRTYESFGENPELASTLGAAAIDGYQQAGVLATAKHFVADGDTRFGTGEGDYTVDQGVTVQSREELGEISLPPYEAAVAAGVGSVMPSYSSVDLTDDGTGNPVKMHAHRDLITGWLKEQQGFDGFVVSDWEAIHQIPPGASDAPTRAQIVASVNAGVDMFMEPTQYRRFHERLITAVEGGEISMSRIDDAVSRILTAKFELGLFENPWADRTDAGAVGSGEHRAVAREAVAASQVLLKNEGDALPLDPSDSVYVAGRNADDLGNQMGGWTRTWQGYSGDASTGTTILEGIRSIGSAVTFSEDASAPMGGADAAIVVVGETPYAEGYGDVGGPRWGWDPADGGVQREAKSMSLQSGDAALVERVCAAIETCVVLVVSGRPQVVTAQLDGIDALVASWLPGSEGAGVADVLFGRSPFTGKLPVSWPRDAGSPVTNVGDEGYDPQFPYGWGLTTGEPTPSPTPTPSTTPTPSPTPSATPSPSSGSCSASLRVVNSWGGGYQADVTVTAGSGGVSGWRTTLPSGVTVTQVWNGTLSGNTVSNVAWNGNLGAGQSTSYGFIGSGSPPSSAAMTCG